MNDPQQEIAALTDRSDTEGGLMGDHDGCIRAINGLNVEVVALRSQLDEAVRLLRMEHPNVSAVVDADDCPICKYLAALNKEGI